MGSKPWGQAVEIVQQGGTEEIDQKKCEWITRRFISIGYYALVDIKKIVPRKNEIDESIGWYDIQSLPPVIMDHHEIIQQARPYGKIWTKS